jgi:hypothetical protein
VACKCGVSTTSFGETEDVEPDRQALFRGIAPSLIRSVPAAGSTFLAFEVTKSEYASSRFKQHQSDVFPEDYIIEKDLL